MLLTLRALPGRLAICRLEAGAPLPAWATRGDLWSITRTPDELSLVVPEAEAPAEVRAERGWRALAVEGPLDMALTGVLAGLAGPLAEAGIPLFAISTFDTDILLVRERHLPQAVAALERAGHRVAGVPGPDR